MLHNFNKGWYDGTCYGDPIKGSLEAVKKIAKKYKIIIFSSKVRPDRPLVRGKNGYQLVKEWLKKHGYSKYISEITHENLELTTTLMIKQFFTTAIGKVLGQVKVK